MKRWVFAAACGMALGLALAGQAEQLYGSDFEDVAVGDLPPGWTKVWDGTTTASVLTDPLDAGNRVLSGSDLAAEVSRHDVGGSIYAVGDAGWGDYIVEYDALFPADFYVGTVFRYVDDTNFYLLDRRFGGEAGNYDFWHQSAGWNRLGTGVYPTDVETWYSFRLIIIGDTFTAHIGTPDQRADFGSTDPLFEATNAELDAGPFGLYGLLYIDNLVIGETEGDMTLGVDSRGKLATSWAGLKR